jgi:hypothetical protein
VTDSIAACRGAAVRILFAFLRRPRRGSCGSGAVSPQVNDPTVITIMPNTATLYSGLPTQFALTGGTGQYIVTSSNQAAVQVSGTVPGGTLVIVPNYVVVDTPVTLTVRDTVPTLRSRPTLTVKPNPVNNDVTITPSADAGGGVRAGAVLGRRRHCGSHRLAGRHSARRPDRAHDGRVRRLPLHRLAPAPGRRYWPPASTS